MTENTATLIRTANGRLTEPMVGGLDRYDSRTVETKLEAVHAFDKAHLVMLVEQGLVGRQDGALMLSALRHMEKEGAVATRMRVGGALHSGEYYLTERLGPKLGGTIHLGRSSADLAGVSRRIVLRTAVLSMARQLIDVQLTILNTAPDHLDCIIPAYTHGQPAQPTTYAHWLMMWANVFHRDTQRLLGGLDRLNLSPAGAAVATGTDFAIDRSRVATLLGFDGILVNTMDATLSNDVFAEYVSIFSLLCANMGRLAEDLLFWSTQEAGIAVIPDRFCDTSSIMSQKRNPSFLHELRAMGAEAASTLLLVSGTEFGTTGQSVHARKTAENAVWALVGKIIKRLPQMADLIASTEIDPQRAMRLTENSWSQATDVASALVRHLGLNWREAHHVVSILVRLATERRLPPDQVDLALLRTALAEAQIAAEDLDGFDIADAVDVRAFVERRTNEGSPAPSAVTSSAACLLGITTAQQAKVEAAERTVAEASKALESAIDSIVND
ncbi:MULTISPECIES: argininosuccinate lyase [Chelativorans]|jgi:argininosuccinate lyase|uniref:argininosuccinate lyase n=1 Tax=Chelativorans sp. (strain BNC1) TaxID=266779 RepID=Q11F19_CHESB|nr:MULTISPECIES: argininosuccinate lyase [Chelativorans]